MGKWETSTVSIQRATNGLHSPRRVQDPLQEIFWDSHPPQTGDCTSLAAQVPQVTALCCKLKSSRMGCDAVQTSGMESDLYMFDRSANVWQTVNASGSAPSARSDCHMMTSTSDGMLWVFGGDFYNGKGFFSLETAAYNLVFESTYGTSHVVEHHIFQGHFAQLLSVK